MTYEKKTILRDGRECVIRSATEADAEGVLENFIAAHGQTDFLASYPDEITFTVEQEADYLKKKAESDRSCEIIAVVDGAVVGTAGNEPVGRIFKTAHRASFGISVDSGFWGLGIGRALTEACISLAREAGYSQLELDVVETNERAVALYRSVGFKEYGRNPGGFRSRINGLQTLVLIRMEL